MTKSQTPKANDLLWPTLKALEELGGSASIQELSEQVAKDLELSDEILNIPHQDSPQSEVESHPQLFPLNPERKERSRRAKARLLWACLGNVGK